MSAPDTITLPRSGVTMKMVGFSYQHETDFAGMMRLRIRDDPAEFGPVHSKGLWSVWLHGLTAHVGTREECIAKADEWCVDLRRALLAGTEETVARVCWDYDREDTWRQAAESEREHYYAQARAVIAALGGEE